MRWLIWGLIGAVGAGGLWVAGSVPDPTEPGPGICLLRRAGQPCPGCGLTRAVVALGAGDLEAAHRWHPLALPFAVEAFALWLAAGWLLARGRRLPSLGSPAVHTWLWAHLGALVALWLGRVATGTLPP